MTSTLFLDIENDDDRLLLVGWALDDGDVVVNSPPVKGDGGANDLDWLIFTDAVKNPETVKVTAGDHDLRFFLMHGYEVAGPWHNVQVMAWVLDENQKLDLESLTKRYTPGLVKHKALAQAGGRVLFDIGHTKWALDEYDSWTAAAKFVFAEYNRKDVETLRALYWRLDAALREDGWHEYWQAEEVPYSSLLLRMETRGLPVDLTETRMLADEVRLLRDESAKVLRAEGSLPASFNLNSPDQLREYLFSRFYLLPDRLPLIDPEPDTALFETTKVGRVYRHGHWLAKGRGLSPTDPPKKKGKKDAGKPSTASPELLYRHGDDVFVRELCFGYRRFSKLLGTYLDRFPEVAVEGRIYGRFNQTGTVTGRLSSSDPNLQNIPARHEFGKRVRGLFRGNLVIGDYDALEMRLMAHFSEDPRLVQVFLNGEDPHELTARAIFGECDGHDDPRRDIGKTVNYAVGYGAGARTLAQTLSLAGFPTRQSEAKEYQEAVAAFYPRLYRWMNSVIWTAKETHYIETIGGHRRRLVEGESDDWTAKSYGERQAVNAVVQGSAADILRRVMMKVDDEPWMKLIAQVHDELIWEYARRPNDLVLDRIQYQCEVGHGFDLKVPLVFVPKICEGWNDK